ncbi:hypothetical protein CN431_08500 [Bacillus cereus]|nr:hypothetical protein CN431_08500 [Bacillus cereus]
MKKIKEEELLAPDKMTSSFTVNKDVHRIKSLLPFKIKKTDNFQVLSYTLKVREIKLVHRAHELPAQHYPSIKAEFTKFLANEVDSFKLCFCPIYFITLREANVLEGIPIQPYKEEKLAYVGKTNSKYSRFSHGHLATQKLNEYMYYDKLKTVFMTQVYIDFQNTDETGHQITQNDVALEWIEFEEENVTQTIIDFIESYLIFGLRPELNELDNPAFQTSEYIQEPSILSKYHLNPSTFKVIGSTNMFKVIGSTDMDCLLEDFNVLEEIKKLGHPWEESIDFFQKYGFIPKV